MFMDETISRNQVHAGLLPKRAWFKKWSDQIDSSGYAPLLYVYVCWLTEAYMVVSFNKEWFFWWDFQPDV